MIQARLRGADYRNVTLLDSPFRSQRDETIALYLEHPSNDDILHRYRLRAGIPSHVDGMVGWGPSIGQYLGAYAKWYSNTRDQRIYDKAMDLFHGWAECVEKNEDLLDLARGAKVTATSVKTCEFFGKGDPNLRPGPNVKPDRAAHDLAHHDRAAWFARGTLDRLEAVECLMRVDAAAPVPLTLRVWGADTPANGPTGGELLATWRGTAPVRRQAFVRFAGEGPVNLTKPYVWLEIGKTKGVSWLVRNRPIGPADGRAWRSGKEWIPVRGEQYAFVATPQVRQPFDSRAEYVIDGVSRPEGACSHGWVSAPAQPLPQTLRLDFPKPVTAQEVRLTFDTDLTPSRVALNPFPRVLAKSYEVEGFDGTAWRTLASESQNGLRHRIHRFEACRLTAVRVTVTETWGDPSARIFEIRVY